MPSLKTKVVSALRWTAVARFTAQIITWAMSLAVIRLLKPSDYGLMAMAEVLFSLLMMMSSAGLGSALIQAKEVTERQVSQMFGLLLLVNVGLAAVLYAVSPLMGMYYGSPGIVPISRVFSIGFLLVPFITIPGAMLSREIDFKRKSIVELIASVGSALTILVLAYLGFGVWALVTGRILNLTLQAIGLNLVQPIRRLPIFSLRAALHLVGFGGIYTLTTVLWFLYSQADVVIAGPRFDETTMGYYAVALHLAALAVTKIMPLLNQIALPAYSRLQNDASAVGYYFLKVIRIVSLLTFPAFLGLACVAPEFVRVILGDRYLGAIEPIILLSLMMPMRIVNNLFPAMVFGMGRPRLELGTTIFSVIVMPIAFLVGVHWGLRGLCLAWLLGYPIVVVYRLHRSCPVIDLRARDILAACGPAATATLAMSLAVLALKTLPLGGVGGLAELLLLILAGVVVYAGFVWTLLRDRAREVLQFARSG